MASLERSILENRKKKLLNRLVAVDSFRHRDDHDLNDI